jgi:four helix bundle protein
MNEESSKTDYLENDDQSGTDDWMGGLVQDPVVQYKNVLVEKSFSFAISVINLHKRIVSEKRDFEVASQFVRSGTSIGALIREAQNAESRADFIHKLGIAQKECDETCYWLELMVKTDIVAVDQFDGLHAKSWELLRIIRSSIITSKNRINQSKGSLPGKAVNP